VAESRQGKIVLSILTVTFAAGFFFIANPRPALAPVTRALKARCPGWLRKAQEAEEMIRTFAKRHPAALRKMFWLDLGCQILLALEVAAVLLILAIPLHLGTVLALEAANRGVKMVTGWMPARIGADEGATAGTFAILGLSSASGLALAFTRRMRDLLWCAMGFGWLAWKINWKSKENGEMALCRP
jgi:hypothetical protein